MFLGTNQTKVERQILCDSIGGHLNKLFLLNVKESKLFVFGFLKLWHIGVGYNNAVILFRVILLHRVSKFAVLSSNKLRESVNLYISFSIPSILCSHMLDVSVT